MRTVAILVLTGSIALGAQGPPPAAPAQTPGRAGSVGPRPNVGPADRPRIDPVAVDRARRVWAAECITCHGSQGRGSDTGPNLIRSVLVLRDRYGSELGPFLKKGHPMQSGAPSASLTDEQISDVSQLLRQFINDTFRGSPSFAPQNVRVGDAAAGEAYFNGEGQCSTCHTATTRSLAGIGTRITNPSDMQQRFLFPPRARGGGAGGRGARGGGAPAAQPSAITVTLTPASGPAVSGVLVDIDDFYVTYRDASGSVRVVKRTPALKVTTTDPLAAHHALLDRITDKQIHDLVAYLETLK